MGGARASLGAATEWQAAQYPQLSANAVRFANKLNQQVSGGLELTSGEQCYMLRPGVAMYALEFPMTVQCNINGHSVQLGFDVGLCNLLFSDWLPLEDIAALPDDLRKSLIIAVLGPVADFFTKHSAGSFDVEDIKCQSTLPPRSSLFFNLSSTNGDIIGQAFADPDEQTVETLDKIWQAAAKPASFVNTKELPIWVEVAVASTALNLEEFRQLREDDIILLNKAFSDLNEVYARISDNICFSSVIDGNKLIIQTQGGGVMASDEQSPENQESQDQEAAEQQADILNTEQTSPSNEASFDAPPPSALNNLDNPDDHDSLQTMAVLNDLSDLPVELLFVVDQIKATLKEVEQIKPGYVFELNRKNAGQVEIRTNGVLVGNGELVQIDDRAGVRVLRLYNRKKAGE